MQRNAPRNNNNGGSEEREDVAMPQTGETYVAEDGTVSQVLDYNVDANYEPTEEEVLEFAEWIGMKMPEDKALLWVAREGLKTPLPKEWRPCRTNEEEIYYFNFKTGESRWEHPLDDVYKEKFLQEKAKLQQQQNSKSNRAGSSSRRGSISEGGGGGSSTKAAAKRAHSSSVLDTSNPCSSNDLQAVRHQLSTDNSNASFDFTRNVTSPNNNSTLNSSRLAPALLSVSLHQAPRLSGSCLSPTFSQSSGGGGGIAAGAAMAGTPTNAAATAAPLLSEAERALEERFRTELRAQLEEEKREATKLHEARMQALQELHTADMAELLAEDKRRREAAATVADEARQKKLQETRQRCDDTYRPQLYDLEHQTEELRAQVTRLQAEHQRAAGAEVQEAEKKAAADLAAGLRKVDAEVLANKKRAREELDAAFNKQRMAYTTVPAVATEAQRLFQDREQAIVQAHEAKCAALEAEKKRLEAALVEAKERKLAPAASSAAAAPRGASPSQSLQAIAATKEARLQELRDALVRETTRLKKEKEPVLAQLRKDLCAAEGPVAVTVATTAGTGAQAAAAAAPGASSFNRQLMLLRQRYEQMRQETMAALRKERDDRLSRIGSTPGTPSLGTPSPEVSMASVGASAGPSAALTELKAKCAASTKEKADFYTQLQEDMRARLAAELTDPALAGKSLEAQIEAAVATDMDFYKKEVLARRERMELEAKHKADKAIAENDLALRTYEVKLAAMEARKAQEIQEMQESLMEEIIAEAVAKERQTLEDSKQSVLARRTANYKAEEDAIRAEVDEEIHAYEHAEKKKIQREANNELASSASASVSAMLSSSTPGGSGAKGQVEAARQQLEAQRAAQEAEKKGLTGRLAEANRKVTEHRAALRAAASATTATPSPAGSPLPAAPVAVATTAAAAAPIVIEELEAGSVTPAAHAARLAALEHVYADQERSLQEELRSWREKRSALAVRQAAAAAATGPPATTTTATVTTTTLTSPPAPPTAATDATLQYLQEEQQSLQERQRSLQAAREAWLRGEESQQSAVRRASPSAAAASTSRLTEVVTDLSSRLDELTSQLLERQQRRPSGQREGLRGRSLSSKWGALLRRQKGGSTPYY